MLFRKKEKRKERAWGLCQGDLVLTEEWAEGEVKLGMFIKLPNEHAIFFLNSKEVTRMATALTQSSCSRAEQFLVADHSEGEKMRRLEIVRTVEGEYEVVADMKKPTGGTKGRIRLAASELWALRELLRVSYLRMVGWM